MALQAKRCPMGRLVVFFLLAALSLSQAFAQSAKPVPIYDPANKKVNAKPMPPGAALPQTAHPRGAASPGSGNNSACSLITFEGLGDVASIPTFYGVSLPDWLSIIENNAGGSGNFADEPSPVTIAFWLYGNPTSQSILIPNGASSISLYYSSYYTITLTALDANGNQIATVSGPPNFDFSTDVYDIWSPITISAPSGTSIATLNIAGYANYTGIDNLSVCQSAAIAAVEATQAIQQYQTLSDLETSLSTNGEPPVPIIAGKRAVLRTYLNPLQAVTDVTVQLSGVATGTQSLAVDPQCTPAQQRSRLNGCQSIDFYFTPPTGSWQATLDVFDSSGNMLEEEVLPFTSRRTKSLVLKPLSICDAAVPGSCEDANSLQGKASLLAKIAPSSSTSIDFSSASQQVAVNALDTITYPDSSTWDTAALNKITKFYGIIDGVTDYLLNRYTTYVGVELPDTSTSPPILAGQGGVAYVGSHAAIVRSSVLRFASNTETNLGVVAHETAHTLGMDHTNTGLPSSSAAPPGCYSTAAASNAIWSYPTGVAGSPSNTNYIQSSAGPEVGFDVLAGAPIPVDPADPNVAFEVTSYCSPRWISPQGYKTMIATLGGGAVNSPSSASPANGKATASPTGPAETPATEQFWLVSGVISGSKVTFNPLFQLLTEADTSAETGTYSLVLEDASGTALFTRNFTPTMAATETKNKDVVGEPDFSQLLPVTAGAAAIVLLSPSSAELGRITLGGKPPVVTITSPSTGFVGTGVQTVSWTVPGPGPFYSLVSYSADGGTTWKPLGEATSSLAVNFDRLPGSTHALIQVLVSDGINTGSATSAAFTVPKKSPALITIDSPTNGFAQAAAAPLYLSGSVYDPDDGLLSGTALQWTDSVAGSLGSGSPLTVTLKPGSHTITLTGTDSDGNSIKSSVTILLGGQPPVVALTVTPLNTVPTTCEYATIAATPGASGGAPLSSAQYSVDGGTTYTSIPLAALPYGFLVPGSGFLHVVARAYDKSGQSNAQDATFFIQSNCSLTTQTITFPALANVTYGAVPIVLSATASSGLPVTYTVTGPVTLNGSKLTITGVGQVSVTASQPGSSSYAAASPVTQTFTIAKAVLKATAANASRSYGAANPAFTYTLTGFVYKDTASVVTGSATLSTTATATSSAGTYPINFATEGLAAANYTFTYVPGTLTVLGGLAQKITFAGLANTTYGASPIQLTATASSGLPVSYAVTGPAKLSGSQLTITGAGLVTVTASQAGNINFAPAPSVSQSFTVAKAALTVTAASLSRPAGAANPILTYSITGFVDGDPASVVTGTATLTTTATTTSTAGTYPITFSTEGLTATNYTFTYVAGVLTVTSGGGQCQVVDYSKGFTTAGLSLNGGAIVTQNLLQLTDGGRFEGRSAFYSTLLPISSFTTDFKVQLLDPAADGMTFVIQSNNPHIIGQDGGGLGYAGIPHSIAFKLDLHNNTGEGTDSTGMYADGAYPSTPALNLAEAGIDLHSGHVFAIHLTYANATTVGTITDTVTGVSVTGSFPGDLTKIVGTTAYVGFTGATGNTSAIQEVLSWSYSGGAACGGK